MEEIINFIGLYAKCVECEGEFRYKEKVCIDVLNQPHCTVCYKEKYEQ